MSIFMLREMAQADPTGMMDEYIDAVEAEVERLRDALRGLLDGLDDYWVTLPEGIAAVEAARAALAGEGDGA